MMEQELGIKLPKKRKSVRKRVKNADKRKGLEDSFKEDKNRLLKLHRQKKVIERLRQTKVSVKELDHAKHKNKLMQLKITDLRYKVQLLENKIKKLNKKLANGSK